MGGSGLRAAGSAALLAAVACTPPPALPTKTQAATDAWFDRALDHSADTIARVDLAATMDRGALRGAIIDVLLAVFDRALGGGPDLHRAVEAASEMTIAAAPAGDPLVILRDVPLALDPRSLPAADGGRQFTLANVGEYVEYNYSPLAGSLFVLRDGTWIVGAGHASQNVKNAFAAAPGAPVMPKRTPSPAVVTLWMPAAALRAVATRERLKLLAPVFLRATSLDGTLTTADVAEAHLHYSTAEDCLEAHATLVDVVRAFRNKNDSNSAWIGTATLAHDALTVTATVTIPPDAFRAFVDAH